MKINNLITHKIYFIQLYSLNSLILIPSKEILSYLLKLKSKNFIKSGFYFDFIIKKFSEVILKNIFIYGATFFSEKYWLEFQTRRYINKILFFFKKIDTIINLKINSLFFILIIFTLVLMLLIGVKFLIF